MIKLIKYFITCAYFVIKNIGMFRFPRESNNKELIYYISSWYHTFVPLYSLTLSRILSESNINSSFLIVDISPYKETTLQRFDRKFIKHVASLVIPRDNVYFLSSYIVNDSKIRSDIIQKQIKLQNIWSARGEIGSLQYEKIDKHNARLFYSSFVSFLKKVKSDIIIMPGGVVNGTFIASHVIRDLNKAYFTFDDLGNSKTSITAFNGKACQNDDIRSLDTQDFDIINDKGKMSYIKNLVSHEINNRKTGKDFRSSQISTFEPFNETNYVLMPLNSSWDSAALGLHNVFDSTYDWLHYSVSYILRNDNDCKIVIRQHPHERFQSNASSDDYSRFLSRNFPDNPRVIFISANMNVNSYQLLDNCRFVVSYTSAFALEAAINKVNVVNESNAYYSNYPFIKSAKNLEEYDSHLYKALYGDYHLSNNEITLAYYIYFLSQLCNFFESDLTVTGYKNWINIKDADLVSLNGTQYFKKAILQGIPISKIKRDEALSNYDK